MSYARREGVRKRIRLWLHHAQLADAGAFSTGRVVTHLGREDDLACDLLALANKIDHDDAVIPQARIGVGAHPEFPRCGLVFGRSWVLGAAG